MWAWRCSALGSVACALAPNAELFLLGRFVQGLGACGGMVIPRAVVRDLHSGVEATRLMSLLMLVFSISPLLAPLTGSFVIQVAGWRGVFWMVLGAAVIGFGILTTLKESRPQGRAREQQPDECVSLLPTTAGVTGISSARC